MLYLPTTCALRSITQNKNQKQIDHFFKTIAVFKNSHRILVKIPKSICAAVSASLLTAKKIDDPISKDLGRQLAMRFPVPESVFGYIQRERLQHFAGVP